MGTTLFHLLLLHFISLSSYYEKFLATGEVKCIDEEIPFEIPDGWEWCRLNDLALYRKGPFGSSLTKSMFVAKGNQTIKVYEQKNAIQKDFRLGDYYISKEKFEAMQSFIVKPNDIIVSCAGTIGETYLLPLDAPVGIINQALMRVTLFDLSMAEYWQMYFAYMLLNEAQMKGAGSAIKNIPPFEYLKAVLVPVPPLSEQTRLVERYNLLLSLIAKYESEANKLNCLNLNIYDKLKKTILQEAIQGKLVQQIAEEGTAQELLEQIKTEKQKLVKEGKIKKSALNDSIIYKGDDNKYWEKNGKNEKDITDEIPFEIPDSWCWIRLNNLCNITNGFTPLRTELKFWENGNINWFTVEDIRKQGEYIYETTKKITELAVNKDRIVRAGSVLLCCTASVGQCAMTMIPTTTNQQFNALTVKEEYRCIVNDEFLFLFAKTLEPILHDLAGKTTFEFISVKKVGNILIPIPPVLEQHRICKVANKAIASIMRG